MAIIAGVDGCKTGWCVVQRDTESRRLSRYIAPDFLAVLDKTRGASIVAVDIPIGLLDAAVPGGRACDIAARKLLGPKRGSSVFPPPVRATLDCRTYHQASKANQDSSLAGIRISQQCFAILPKIREVDRAMTPELQRKIREIHPELCFFALNGGNAITQPKRTANGMDVRLVLLQKHGFGSLSSEAVKPKCPGVETDDILDACAACWTAERICLGAAVCIPPLPARDTRGLRMEMWY